MGRHFVLPAYIVSGFLSVCSAAADPAYRAGQIVEFFASQPDGEMTRALCVGTQAECAQGAAAAPTPPSFDLLVTFELNSNELTPEAKQNLDEFAKALKDPRLRGATFTIEGHTDARGGESYNMKLSRRRADAVVRYLTQKGAPAKLTANGYGERKPKTPDPLDAVNRRVETRIAR